MESRWRRSEFISLGTLFMVAGWIWYASAKVNTWDENIKKCEDPSKGIDGLDRRVTTLETHVKDKDDEILRQFGVLFRKMDERDRERRVTGG